MLAAAALAGANDTLVARALAAPITVEKFAIADVITSATVSPDGKYLALIKNQPRSGETLLEVFDASAFGEDPFRVSHEPMRLMDLAWVTDSKLLLSLLKHGDEPQKQSQSSLISIVDVKKERVTLIPEPNPMISSFRPTDDLRMVMSLPRTPSIQTAATSPMPSTRRTFSLGRNAPEVRWSSAADPIAEMVDGLNYPAQDGIASRFRPRNYFSVNLRTNKKLPLVRLSSQIAQIEVDGDGKPWLGRGLDAEQSDYVWYVPNGENDDWKEIFRLATASQETFQVDGFDVDDPNILFVTATNGDDSAGLWEFMSDSASFGELIYRRRDADVVGVRFHSNTWANPDTVTGLVYFTDREHVEYFDSSEASLNQQLAGMIPASYHLSITSRSRDGTTLTLHNVGPQDPGSYYLLRNGTLKFIGSSSPLVSSADLAALKYLSYESAGGAEMSAYATVPQGIEPFPMVLLWRHEPGIREVVDYDVLAQVLANNGYLVVRPLLHDTQEFSQADADATIDFFVEQGMADRDRIALLGWGYDAGLALQAATRTAQAFQCVMAAMTSRSTSEQSPQTRKLSSLPIENAEDIDVPIFLAYRGSDPVAFLNSLEIHGKAYKAVTADDSGPAYGAKFFDFKVSVFASMIDFLRNDCGPSGL